jgi:hypothetical protein
MSGLAALPILADPSPAAAASGLQVAVVPPGTVSGQATIPLDVKFHGGNIRVIELFVDGTQLTRQAISTKDGRGTVHFSLDPTLFTEGSHEVLIKAYEADGTCATTTTQVVVAATSDLSGPARIEWPKSKSEVQGIVPIKIKIDPTIMDPYVTYTIDNDFLAFRNYAPYVYNWDTSKMDNGLHSIGIEVMDGRTLQVVQKIKLAVNVKNVMGFTKIPPAAAPSTKVESGNVSETVKKVAESAAPSMGFAARDAALNLARGSANASQPFVRRNSALSGFRTNSTIKNGGSPGRFGSRLSNLPLMVSPLDEVKFVATNLPIKHSGAKLQPSMISIGARTVDRPVTNPGGSHIPAGLAALAANPRDLMPLDAGITLKIARQSVHFRRGGGIALRPGTVRHASRGGAAPAPAAFRPISRKSFDVAFNNNIINFDVAPRIENGLPLAPFRAIFEHNGGKVKWFNEAKIVRATDSDREIEIKIGSKDAKVNNQSITMEAVPYLDHGRTIVPLSFVRDSMDVKVTFDKETGHLLIEKK